MNKLRLVECLLLHIRLHGKAAANEDEKYRLVECLLSHTLLQSEGCCETKTMKVPSS